MHDGDAAGHAYDLSLMNLGVSLRKIRAKDDPMAPIQAYESKSPIGLRSWDLIQH